MYLPLISRQMKGSHRVRKGPQSGKRCPVLPSLPVRLGLFVLAASVLAGPSPGLAAEPMTPQIRAAKKLFVRYCIRCHGNNGRGAPARSTMPTIPNFTNPSWHPTRSNVQLMISILEGKNRLMPANRGVVSDSQAADLVAFIRTFDPSRKVASRSKTVPSGPSRSGPIGVSPLGPASGDFEVQFNQLAKQYEDLDRQLKEVTSAAPPATVSREATAEMPATGTDLTSSTPKEQSLVAGLPFADRPFTAEDVDRGRELFNGKRPLANGGPSCIACHTVHGTAGFEGGRLGPDLTKAYERLGGRNALIAHLWASRTPTMLPVYQQHPLKAEEAVALAAYLEQRDREGVEEAASVPMTFLLWGLGGTVLGLVLVNVLFGRRLWPRTQPVLDGNLAAAMPVGNGVLPLSRGRRTEEGAIPTGQEERDQASEEAFAHSL